MSSDENYHGPINPTPGNGEAAVSLYGYVPTSAFPVIAILTFGLSLLAHTTNFARLRSTRVFEGLLVAGSAMEICGYGCRLASHFNPFRTATYIAQYILVVLAPLLFQAALYVGLSQALRRLDCTGRSLLHFNPKILVIGLVISDSVTTILQVIGAVLVGVAEKAQYGTGSSPISSKHANDILLTGLCVQTASFVLFIGLLVLCIYRSATTYHAGYLPKKLSLLLTFTSTLLLLRTTFRVAETGQSARNGPFGGASASEVLFACLEYLPVILAVAVWAAVSMDSVLPIQVDEEPDSKGERMKSIDKRMIRKADTLELGNSSTKGTRDGKSFGSVNAGTSDDSLSLPTLYESQPISSTGRDARLGWQTCEAWMVATALFLAAIIVPAASVVLLVAWSGLVFLKYRSLVRPPPPGELSIPPLVTTLPRRPLNHHLASSDAYSTLDHVSLAPSARPLSFLEIDPAPTPAAAAIDSAPRTGSTHGRFSIATSTSRKRGSRVLVRNPSSLNSHGTVDTAETQRGDGGYVVIERTKRNRKSFGIGHDASELETESVGAPVGPRRRSSTWTADELDSIKRGNAMATNGALGMLTDTVSHAQASVRPSSATRQTSLDQALPYPPSRPPSHVTLDMPSFHFDTVSNDLDPSRPLNPEPTWRPQTLPPRQLDPRLSTSSQALFDLEVYAAGLSQPSTPSFSPLPLSAPCFASSSASPLVPHASLPPRSMTRRSRVPDVARERLSAPTSRVPSPDRRPLSWVKRQTSSGTLPDRILDRDRLAVSPSRPPRPGGGTSRESRH
ncbi:hypothetical protein JCM11491_004082 [Sporobolomyces phaffii]